MLLVGELYSLQCYSMFTLLLIGDRAELLQHAQSIKQSAELGDLAGGDAVEHKTRHCYLPASRRYPLELTLVGTSSCPPFGDLVIFGDHLFKGGMPVGERTAQGHGERFEVLLAHLPTSWQNDRCIGSHQLICRCGVPLVPKLL